MTNNDLLLAIDIGNTTCEAVIINKNNEIFNKFFVVSKPLEITKLHLNITNLIKQYPNLKACVASVVPDNNPIIVDYLTNQCNIPTILIEHHHFNNQLTIDNTNENFQHVGIDILCKTYWNYFYKNQPIIIVDVGTATVLQTVLNNNILHGVAISIGLSGIYKYLNSNTALLPLIKPQITDKLLALNTLDAIQNGVYWSYIGAIKQMLYKAHQETNCHEIILTGGMSDLIIQDIVNQDTNLQITNNKNLIFESINYLYHNVLQ